MPLKKTATIELPKHAPGGGFDHAAYHSATGLMYVAHTSNDSLDWIDCRVDRYIDSIPGLRGIAGALVSDARNLVFTSNRGEDSIGIFAPGKRSSLIKVEVGVRPNGLAFDPERMTLLAANVGRPGEPASHTLSIVDAKRGLKTFEIPVPGRTRWTVFDPLSDSFFVNIGDPALILSVRAADPSRIDSMIVIPAKGPHGLDIDIKNRRLYCACDSAELFTIELDSKSIVNRQSLSGVPDVTFYNPKREHLYVATGDPGLIDVFDTRSMAKIQSVQTGRGAHTIGLDFDRSKIYAFLPETHSALVFEDSP
jgi:DNA-binding beta-propeller fold protein YncE